MTEANKLHAQLILVTEATGNMGGVGFHGCWMWGIVFASWYAIQRACGPR